jgi:hypothetical protein
VPLSREIIRITLKAVQAGIVWKERSHSNVSCLFLGVLLCSCGPCLICVHCRGENPFEHPWLLVLASIPFSFSYSFIIPRFYLCQNCHICIIPPSLLSEFQLHHPLPFLSRNFLVGSYYASKSCSGSSVHLMSPLARVVISCITLCFSQCNCIQHSCYS